MRRHLLDFVLLLSFFVIAADLLSDFSGGGNSWKQGDWLINNAAGAIRRGPLGSALIAASDSVGLSPVATTIAVQLVLLIGLIVVFRYLLKATLQGPDRLLVAFAAAGFVVFWAADPQGSVRKELLAFVGLCVLAAGAIHRRTITLWAGVGVTALSFIAHEAMVLFTPLALGIILLSGYARQAPAHAIAASLVLSFAALASLAFAITHAQISDTTAMCAALLERGAAPTLCDGAIAWLGDGVEDARAAVAAILSPAAAAEFALAYAVALAPFVFIALRTNRPLAALAMIAATALPFLPLYAIAVDWGRWMSFHSFSITLVLMCALAGSRVSMDSPPPIRAVAVIVVLSLLASPSHMIGL